MLSRHSREVQAAVRSVEAYAKAAQGAVRCETACMVVVATWACCKKPTEGGGTALVNDLRRCAVRGSRKICGPTADGEYDGGDAGWRTQHNDFVGDGGRSATCRCRNFDMSKRRSPFLPFLRAPEALF